MRNFLRLIAHRDAWSEDVDFMLQHFTSLGSHAVCTGTQFTDVPAGGYVQPTFRLCVSMRHKS